MNLSLRHATVHDAPFGEVLNHRNMDRYRAARGDPLGPRALSQELGIGNWAVRQTQALARERGYTGAQLRVYVQNPAARLYHRLGFEALHVAGGVIHMAWAPSILDSRR